eukprot:364282-Rhodomonas_salina.1
MGPVACPCRHAEATSNKAAEGLVSGSKERNDVSGLSSFARNLAYDDPAWFDARLSVLCPFPVVPGLSMHSACRASSLTSAVICAQAEGLKQCAKLRESTEFLSYQLVLVSPLTRALHTAKLGLPDNPKIPVIALNAARERVGQYLLHSVVLMCILINPTCVSSFARRDSSMRFEATRGGCANGIPKRKPPFHPARTSLRDVPAGPDPKLCKMCFPAPPCFRLTLTENDQRNLAHATQQLVLTSVCV